MRITNTMIEFPLHPDELREGTIISFAHKEPNELLVKLPDGRIAVVTPNGDEFEVVYRFGRS